jgi:hypothetical protein
VCTAVVVGDTNATLGLHVEVEVGEDLVDLGGIEVLAVVLGAEKAVLFSAPPGEAYAVAGAVLSESVEELDKKSAAGGCSLRLTRSS